MGEKMACIKESISGVYIFLQKKCYRTSENLSKIPQKIFETETNVLQVLKLSAAQMGLTD